MTASRGEVLAAALLLAAATAALPARAADPGPPQRLAPPQRLTPLPAPRPAEPAAIPEEASPGTPTAPAASPLVREGGIKIDALAPVDPDWTGILEQNQGALPPTMWQGTPRGFVSELVPRLPVTTTPAVQELERRLLLSTAAAPEGKDEAEKPGLLARRIERLVALGQVEAADSVLKSVPGRRDEGLDRTRIELRLLQNDRDGACSAVEDGVKRYQGAWWDRALIACQTLRGEHAKATLGLSLLREQKAPADPTFDALVERAGGRGGKAPALGDLSPLHFALLRAGKGPLPSELAAVARPAVLRSVALDGGAPLPLRLAAAERALAFGALPPATLRELYGKMEPSPEDRAEPQSRAAAERSARGRALLFEAARTQPNPSAKAELLRAYLEQSRGAGVYFGAVRAAEPLLLEVKPSPELAGFAGEATRAFLALRRPAEAVAWLGAADPDTARPLQPLARIAFGRGAPQWDARTLGAAIDSWLKRDGEAGPRQAVLALTLLAALDEPVGPADWTPVLAKALPSGTGPQPAPLFVELPKAAAARRVGETVLLATLLLGDGERVTVQPLPLAAAVGALKAAGFENEARAAALEAALAAGL
jgi:hypothetical protein